MATKREISLLPLALLLVVLGCAHAFIKVDPKTQLFIDESNRVRLFHGVNAVFKIPPWIPLTDHFDPSNSFSAEDITQLKQWGFNAVRLGVMWPGVEPVSGEYNTTYLELVGTLVNNLAKAGIYTIIDAHQDLISRYFCGEGLPDWAFPQPFPAKPFPMPVAAAMPVDNTTHYPPLDLCLQKEFAEYYFSDSVGIGFERLYTNVSGLTTSFEGYWALVAKYFANNTGVLGYELLNEPWPGDIREQPSLLIPGVADKQNLFPLYQTLNTVIRSIDNEHIIFFEKALTDLLGATGFPSGPGGASYNDRQAYSYHVYCAGTDSEGNPRHIMECDGEDMILYETFMNDLKRLGCGGFMTEFGAVDNGTNSIANIEFLTYVADMHLQSWAYWQFKYFADLTTSGSGEAFYTPEGELNEPKVRALSRTYAYAVAGIPTTAFFNPSTSKFILTYTLDTSITAPTEIYLNEQWYYANGYNVTITPPTAASWSTPSTNIVYITAASGVQSGTQITVTISQK